MTNEGRGWDALLGGSLVRTRSVWELLAEWHFYSWKGEGSGKERWWFGDTNNVGGFYTVRVWVGDRWDTVTIGRRDISVTMC